MALQTSGAISLNDIQTEFGGSNPISLSEYYGADSGIPASGAISIGDFYGASAGIPITVTQAVLGASIRGYYSPYGGSVSPTSVLGYPIEIAFRHATSSIKFQFYLTGSSISATLFTALQVQTSSGFTELLVADGFSTQNANNRYWAWYEADFASAQEYSDFVTEWDGTGDVVIKVIP